MGRYDKPHRNFSMRFDAGLLERLARYVDAMNVYERAKGKKLTTKTSVIETAVLEYLNDHDGILQPNIELSDEEFLKHIRNEIDDFLKEEKEP